MNHCGEWNHKEGRLSGDDLATRQTLAIRSRFRPRDGAQSNSVTITNRLETLTFRSSILQRKGLQVFGALGLLSCGDYYAYVSVTRITAEFEAVQCGKPKDPVDE